MVGAGAIQPGVIQALLAAALFGAGTPFAKQLLGSVDPWLLAGLLYLGAGIGLGAVHLGRRALGGVFGGGPAEAPLRRAELPWLGAVVAAGGIAGPVLLMFGLARTEASAASLLLNLEGVLTLAIAWVVFRENVDLRIFLGAGAILLGALLLSWSGGAGFQAGWAGGWGPLAIAGACLAWGIDNNLTRRLSAADPLQIAMVKGLVAGSVNVALAIGRGAAWPAGQLVLAAGAIGLVSYGASLALYVLALRHLGAARTGAYFATAPFLGAVLAIALFHEPLTPALLAAGALMLAGTWLHLVERHEHTHAHEAMEHVHAHVHDAHHQHAHRPEDPPGEPHVHTHRHAPMVHQHKHVPDIHHRHPH